MKKDLALVAVIGTVVGLLIQPILTNTGVLALMNNFLGLGDMALRVAIFFFLVVLAPVILVFASLVGKFVPILYQFAKFAAVGTLNSFIYLGAYNLLILLSGREPEDLSGILIFTFISIAFLFSTTNSYFWNKIWTFGDTGENKVQKIVAFYILTGISYALNSTVATSFAVWGPFWGISGNLWVSFVAPVCGIAVSLMINFIGYKYFIFKKQPEGPENAVESFPGTSS